jgi:hypothetical protein
MDRHVPGTDLGGLWGNASHCLMQPVDRDLVVTWGTDASKSAVSSSCAWHRFGGPLGQC